MKDGAPSEPPTANTRRSEQNAAPSETPPDKAIDSDNLLSALDGTVKPVRRSPFYNLSQLLVAIAMVILPLIYLGLIGGVGYFVFLHARDNFGPIASSGSIRMMLLAYGGPLVVGTVVLIFMVKPLFARPPKSPKSYVLDRKKQPRLFAFVDRLSNLLGAPRPKEIHLDCNVNASAGFRRGVISTAGSDLVLTIGLPLVEGMNLRQLTGVLAHELGHFSQGGGMRVSYVIRRTSHWFARVVYERDRFDLTLEAASKGDAPLLVLVVVWAARACVWISRRILWVLMSIGTVISCMLLRQMEYDADRYEARVAGSQEFEKTVQRLIMLGVGQHVAMNDMEMYWREQKLPNEFPRLVQANAELLSAETREKIWTDRLAGKTKWLDTHPSDADRIQSAVAEKEPGLMRIDVPATSLFQDYTAVSKSVSQAYYEGVVGSTIGHSNLVPTDQLLADRKRETEGFATLERFFQGHVTAESPGFLTVTKIDGGVDFGELKSSVEEARKRLLEVMPDDSSARQSLLRDRLQHSLRLLHTPEVQTRLAEGNAGVDMEDVAKKSELINRLEHPFKKVLSLRRDYEKLLALLDRFEELKGATDFQERLSALAANCQSSLEDLSTLLKAFPYPYEHAQDDCTCSDYAIPQQPHPQDLNAILGISQHCLNCMYQLYFRILADLVSAAERAETSVGLPELPAPAEAGGIGEED
jgi:Zn-dependent protease with chaperone function